MSLSSRATLFFFYFFLSFTFRCNIDPTVIVHPRSHPREFRFSMEAFKFIGLHDQVTFLDF